MICEVENYGKFLYSCRGSGQDAALCYLRLARLCEFEPTPVWIIDADRIGEVSQQFATMKASREKWKVYFVDPFPILGGTQKLFRDLLDDTPEARKVLGVLFTPEQAAVPIRQGMYGRPSVGATVLQYKIHRVMDVGEKDERLSELVEGLKVLGEHRVAITGSTFGGTGSGGVPAVSKYISDLAESEGFPASIFIGGVGFLPWFQLGQPSAEAKRKGVGGIGNTEMIRNSQSSIAYFKGDLVRYIHKLLLIGISDELSFREWKGGTGQNEHKHFLSLLSAYLLHQEVLQKEERRKEHLILGYWIDRNGLDVNSLLVNRAKPSDPQKSEDVSFLQCVRETSAVVELLGLFTEYLNPLPGFGFFLNLTVPKWLRGVIRELGQEKGERQACQMIVDELNKERDVLKHCLKWFLELGSPGLFQFDEKETAFRSDRYEAARRNPMGFFHRWMRYMGEKETPIDENLSQALVRGLRIRIIEESVK